MDVVQTFVAYLLFGQEVTDVQICHFHFFVLLPFVPSLSFSFFFFFFNMVVGISARTAA